MYPSAYLHLDVDETVNDRYSTCDLGLINGGRWAEWRALSKIREMRLVLVKSAA